MAALTAEFPTPLYDHGEWPPMVSTTGYEESAYGDYMTDQLLRYGSDPQFYLPYNAGDVNASFFALDCATYGHVKEEEFFGNEMADDEFGKEFFANFSNSFDTRQNVQIAANIVPIDERCLGEAANDRAASAQAFGSSSRTRTDSQPCVNPRSAGTTLDPRLKTRTDSNLALDAHRRTRGTELMMTGGGGSSGTIHLWYFIRELLDQPMEYGSCVRWMNRDEGTFKIESSHLLARIWGERKNRAQMNYDKLSRSLRQYYKKGIIQKPAKKQRLVYRFLPPYNSPLSSREPIPFLPPGQRV